MKGIAKWLITTVFFLNTVSIYAQFDIIPLPKNLSENSKTFTVSAGTKIYFVPGLKPQAELLAAALSPATGFDIQLAPLTKTSSNGIVLKIDKALASNKEAYHLKVSNSLITLAGSTPAGVFYATQTLLQLLPPEIYNKERQRNVTWKIDGADIQDAPLYAWRGMMLDVSRYFFGKEYVLKFIDMMAMYKMNVLHLHLVDDSGWRLEIKKYPKLTSIGAWRGEGAERTGGYYTQEDIKEIITYAALRNVDVIPEIELPAHTLSAIAAYPHLCCTGEQYEVQTQHSISAELYCVGKESTFEFLADVFKETFEMFPSRYIHIGGDEARYDRWKACPNCQKRKSDLGLTTEKELQVYFNQRVQEMVTKYGKTIVGWDEIIEDGLKDKVVGMIWHDPKKAFKASENGHYSVMTLTTHTYFDMAQSSIPGEVRAAGWQSPIPLAKVYQLNPMLKGLDEKYRPQILGASGALWADQFIHGTYFQEIQLINENRSEKHFDYLTFPRMAALAEVCWTPVADQNWNSFEKRMASHYNRYDNADYGYRVPLPKLISNDKAGDGYLLKIENVVKGAEIRYSIDGTPANVYSAVYTGPVKVEELKNFSAITVVNRNVYSLPLYFPEKYDRFRKDGELIGEWKPAGIKAARFSDFEMNASGKISQNGEYQLSFWYTEGSSRLEIKSITVYKNGLKVAEDVHHGFTGISVGHNQYRFKINNYETGAVFTIRASVRGDISNDSNGAVFIKKL